MPDKGFFAGIIVLCLAATPATVAKADSLSLSDCAATPNPATSANFSTPPNSFRPSNASATSNASAPGNASARANSATANPDGGASVSDPSGADSALPDDAPPRIAQAALSRAVDRGVKYLLANQDVDGSWGHFSPEEAQSADAMNSPERPMPSRADPGGGRTALAVYALLSAGESSRSPAISRALAFLNKCNAIDTYSIGLRAAVYAQLPDADSQRRLRQCVRWLNLAPIRSGPNRWMYGYHGGDEEGDLSNTQYGILGVWCAKDAGVEIEDSYWLHAERLLRSQQRPDGGWGYRPGYDSSLSMTAAGVVTLYLTNDILHTSECHALGPTTSDRYLSAGLNWIASHFSPEALNPHPYYTLFAIERVAEASGYTRFGDHVWFDQAAGWLLSHQRPDGGWIGSLGAGEDTCYALLTLSRGQSPVAFQKLKYDGRWNNRPRDVANITHWLGKETEVHLNWQVVDADAAPSEFRQAPILYVSGDEAMRLTESQQTHIRRYIEEGGLLFCVNEGKTRESETDGVRAGELRAGEQGGNVETSDGGSADRSCAFAASVEAMARRWWPSLRFRDLPVNHPLFAENIAIKNRTFPLRGLSNGARELIVLAPTGDYSWQYQSWATARCNPKQAFPLAMNLFCYATGRTTPRLKLQDGWIYAEAQTRPATQIKIARLQYPGNWNPEPAGWRRLANLLHNAGQIELSTEPYSLTNPDPPTDCALMHLTAAGRLPLSMRQWSALKAYIDGGGVVIFDAAGGSTQAAADFEAGVERLYPRAAGFTPLPLDSEIYTGAGFDGADVRSVRYRHTLADEDSDDHAPRLRGLWINGRLAAICSRQDLGAALAGCQTDGIVGYTPDSAAAIMSNIIKWANCRRNSIDVARTD